MKDAGNEYAWVRELCLQSTSTCPSALVEELMGAPECPAFGPAHHVLAGAALLTCVSNARGDGDLAAKLDELIARSSNVPGGTCARWGACGAALSCGMALAIELDNAPLKQDGWSGAQMMVAELLHAIARAGAPRCCKRDTRIAVGEATSWFSRALGVRLESLAEEDIVCGVSDQNSVCLGGACPYFG